MSPKGSKPRLGRDNPIPLLQTLHSLPDRQDLEAGLIPRYCRRLGGAEEGGEEGLGAVGALDGVDVCWVYWCCEGADQDGAGGEGGGDGVGVQRQDVNRFAKGGEGEGFGLVVAVGAGEVALLGEGRGRSGSGRGESRTEEFAGGEAEGLGC